MKITDLIPWRASGGDIAARTAPTDPMQALQLDVDRAFNQFWRMVPYPFATLGRLEHTDIVRVDVDDNGTEIAVTAELPGMSEADVDVSISDGLLMIRGEKKSAREAEEDGVLVSERLFGVVERTVPLPDGVEPDAAQATFRDGVLTITIPKTVPTPSNTRRVPVHAG